MPKIRFDKSATESIVDGLGFEMDDEGYVVTQEGERVVGIGGEEINKDNIGGIQRTEEGDALFVEDDFVSITKLIEFKRGEYDGKVETYEIKE